jgi:hypothetical protein
MDHLTFYVLFTQVEIRRILPLHRGGTIRFKQCSDFKRYGFSGHRFISLFIGQHQVASPTGRESNFFRPSAELYTEKGGGGNIASSTAAIMAAYKDHAMYGWFLAVKMLDLLYSITPKSRLVQFSDST